jgi:hypothetical protein
MRDWRLSIAASEFASVDLETCYRLGATCFAALLACFGFHMNSVQAIDLA